MTSQTSKANLLPFVKNYFRHPFFKESEVADPYIRVTYAYSDYTRKILEKRKELDATRHTWHAADRIYSRSDFKTRALTELLRSCDQGLDVYYNVNISPRDFGRVGNIPLDMHAKRVRSEHVTNCLFIPIDWDNDLPCGVGKINSELGITPAAVVRSSNRKALPTGLGETGLGHKPRYQMLIAVDPSDSREYDYWLAITRLAAHVLGADPSSAALNKLFRFPGTVNWKQFEERKKKDFSILMSQPQPDGGGPDIGDYPVYTLKDLKNIFENFKRNDLSRLLQANAAPTYRDSNRVVTDALLDGRKKPRLVDVTWEEALVIGEGIPGAKDPKKRIGKPVVEKGERHNALISWAGALAVEVGRGLYTVEEAGDLLRRLAMHACSWSSGESDEAARELHGATRYLNEGAFKEDRKRVERLKKMLGDYAEESTEGEGNAPDGQAGPAVVTDNKPKQLTLSQTLSDKLDEFCTPLENESEDIWFNFLAVFFRELRGVSESTGTVHTLVTILMDRSEQLKLLQDIGFFLPAEVNTAWGSRAFVLRQITDNQLKNYCSISVERLLAACIESREILQKSAIFGPVVKRIKDSVAEECRGVDGELDKADYEKMLKSKLRKYFDLKLTDQLKRVVVTAWVETIRAWSEDRDGQLEDTAVFQNGVFTYPDCNFRVDADAWRYSRYAIHAEFLPGLATELSSGGLDIERLERLLDREIPLFSAFMRSAFPDDVEAWVIMLRIVGYCFIVNNPFDAFFSFYGESGAGKGTLWRLITALIGDADGGNGLTYDLDFYIAAKGMGGFVNAVGKLAVNIDEAESKDATIHDRVFREVNRITSGQKVQVEEKWKTTERRKIGAKLIFTANKPFLFDDSKGAIERRMVAFHFAQVITHQNPNLLKDMLRAGEANKIATIGAVLCSRAWKKGKGMFDGSRATTEGRAELIESMNPLKGILRKFIISSDKITDYIELPEIAKLVEKYSERLSVAEQEKIQWLLAGGDIAVNRGIAGEMKRCGLITELRRMNVTDEATLTRKKVSVCTKVKWNESALKFAGLIET